ncbi:hypothetical protein BX661DRAFT_187766 [Kickxella alabastrina]|uniref:uncharacterized protein n=1 Tax=Kickxella alabastrina TaxID=61397 RepID=UPI0022207ACC|nr:uncharacterized protein BX661DRAFT_187766 [Kickxella alabastrina]KAI7822111.1 hypothetical protein BX661DRAFT_187766 [Kickxella alabastrina]
MSSLIRRGKKNDNNVGYIFKRYGDWQKMAWKMVLIQPIHYKIVGSLFYWLGLFMKLLWPLLKREMHLKNIIRHFTIAVL